MSRWLVTGAGGQLGRELTAALADRDVTRASRQDLDIADPVAVAEFFRRHEPDVVLNAAAYTAVDDAEGEPLVAARVNAVGPGVLAEACARHRALLVHVSTDYVFDGTASRPYAEDAAVSPRGVYGETKAAGERAVLQSAAEAYVVRTAWLYGAHGRNFVKTMIRLERERQTVRVVDDQIGSPTWARGLAGALIELAERRPEPGVYHATNGGEVSWYGFARAIFAELGADPDRVRPTTTAEFPRPAPRPAYSVLGTGRWQAAGLSPLPDWASALRSAFAALDFSSFTPIRP